MNGHQTNTPSRNILIVDDSSINLRLLSQMLTGQGYKVRSATRGAQALSSVGADPPDLILLDIKMPEMDGYEVCERLKADERTRDIPVIFISALDEMEDKVKAFAVGGIDYVTKPFQVEEVLARLETHLALRNLQKDLQKKNTQLEQEIAERMRVEESLRQRTLELESRNAELDAFAHTVAHDLKGPLSSIIGFSGLLQSEATGIPGETRRHFLHRIEQNGLRMSNIVDELLLLDSIRGMEEIETQPLDMGRIVAEAQERLAYLIEEHQAEFILPDNWPMALGYGPWVEEVWVNYISNAIKYGGRPPHVELGFSTPVPEADLDSTSPKGSQSKIQNPKSKIVCFWVRDNGPGLSSEEQAGLFTPFEQLHQARTEGHGLGLAVVRRIVEKLGGQVGVESQVGQGSVFSFTLPAGERHD